MYQLGVAIYIELGLATSSIRSPLMKHKHHLIVAAFSYAVVAGQSVHAQSLSPAQIKQIEEIAQTIANQHNNMASANLDDMTVSTRAVAIGRNVRFEYVLRVKKGLTPAKLREFSDETQREIVPKSCAVNAKNPAFERGLTYTFSYTNTYKEKLAEFTVDAAGCKKYS